MGLTHIEAKVTGPNNENTSVLFLVDSGASYSLLPLEIWQQLGLVPNRETTAVIADGTKLKRQVSECRICINDLEGSTPVILGEKGDEALLGVITLENLGLILDPYKRTLQVMQVRL
jgi:clan AA aspartic protease